MILILIKAQQRKRSYIKFDFFEIWARFIFKKKLAIIRASVDCE